MKDELTKIKNEKISFNFKTNETKYYLLTRGSGYPLAEFTFPDLPESTATRLVIPENMPKTLDMVLLY
ncbi:hypothetical protein L9W92_06745 [Pelotomaculum terephthalicicum JT]|uniref:hypothetical protein n=1 Tax=Pelotomaculum TaxID=191373 RepID=UPI0009C6FE35|nr:MULTISPECIES: hypothetical protein [Pelotomaculum]MCG9967750.1 hypothetical protein [Pelotomaculum terephthalicicum JT]OPX85368.1 MAG: hypothetical protein A4E54_02416 [Pelotomaculum sp. PtaB.Bin117]OPY62699.1 MAG: hypothetical protein A4E56_01153 [Pelotomaculum sp. PtaU1.Bin065]